MPEDLPTIGFKVITKHLPYMPMETYRSRDIPELPTKWRDAMTSTMARPSELFAPCTVEYGDRKTRGMQITCGKCGKSSQVPMNTLTYTTGGRDTTERTDRLCAHKFGRMGWIVGRIASKHRCPDCERATKPFAQTLDKLKKKEEPMPSNGTTAAAPKKAEAAQIEENEPMRDMTRDDRRVIFAKLQDVYENERTGYSREWTDKRVAEDLGVPRAWVAKVRDENFGPDHNAEFIEQIAYARAVVEDVKALHRDVEALRMRHQGELDALNARLKPMLIVMEKTERTIASIQKATVA